MFKKNTRSFVHIFSIQTFEEVVHSKNAQIVAYIPLFKSKTPTLSPTDETPCFVLLLGLARRHRVCGVYDAGFQKISEQESESAQNSR